ncbi:sigma 54-interacting transcriptional regulator [Azospirillum picis]|uniref:HTH-type transcriptional regulatory protein TyrR n=1 Tax=Azospirillum picis TaxID=488438 RepID=A0ABU0MUP8_9PROT|nr:sigma 54-interacting transcriptional regulator [Azospirillum picis]MBP2303377.1 TyrR family helix-turn-helix protein [Azospirillum picis]MDQ0537218.1 TyrR family helix-turn-helix protein [Azospirillum picis]
MRIEVTFADRVGIAHEILAVLAIRRLNVVAVEVDPPLIHIDAPGLDPATLPALSDALRTIPGVQAVAAIDMLPGTRRRLHLDALLAALPDPVLAVDRAGRVVVASTAAAEVAGVAEARLAGLDIGELFAVPGLTRELIDGGFRMSGREVTLSGQPFLLEVTPIVDIGTAGAVITLFTPSRLGERLDALQNFDEFGSGGGFDRILGESQPVRALKARAVRVAAMEAPLLILGETGTGKELIAHACHRASPRRDKPFLALNCAAVPENLAESELFGYAPGAFTGAQRGGKPGLLELAHGGTVFLDEIGEMSAYLQAKLLRFLNDGSFRRVGGERERKVDVRVVSATHRSLEAMVADHSFREDLFYRLNVLSLNVPPLRERGDDILLLARHFIVRACAQARRPPCRLTPAAASALLANRWPGNVRQLENVIFRAVTMSDGGALDVPDLELAGAGMLPADVPAEEAASWEEAVEGFERTLLRRLYPRFPSSRKLAARLATSHTMIANKLRKYGIPER